MNKERELLQRVRDTLHGLKETYYDLYWDIQTALEQPEQEPEAWIAVNKETGYRTQVSHFPDSYDKNTFEVIPLYITPLKREPLGLEIMDVCGSEDYREGFKDGALYAEKAHGIGVDDEN